MVGVLGIIEVKSGDCKAALKATRTRDKRTTTIWMTFAFHYLSKQGALDARWNPQLIGGAEVPRFATIQNDMLDDLPMCRDPSRYLFVILYDDLSVDHGERLP